MGAIGKAVAKRLRAFDCTLRYHDAHPLDRGTERALSVRFAPLDEMLAASDYVVLALPLTPETTHVIDAQRLTSFKPGAFLINPARGSLVDEAAVADAIDTGMLGGYAADVFELEDWARADRPRSIDPRLTARRDRTLLTPHIGSAVESVRVAIAEAAIDSVIDFFSGRAPRGAIAGTLP